MLYRKKRTEKDNVNQYEKYINKSAVINHKHYYSECILCSEKAEIQCFKCHKLLYCSKECSSIYCITHQKFCSKTVIHPKDDLSRSANSSIITLPSIFSKPKENLYYFMFYVNRVELCKEQIKNFSLEIKDFIKYRDIDNEKTIKLIAYINTNLVLIILYLQMTNNKEALECLNYLTYDLFGGNLSEAIQQWLHITKGFFINKPNSQAVNSYRHNLLSYLQILSTLMKIAKYMKQRKLYENCFRQYLHVELIMLSSFTDHPANSIKLQVISIKRNIFFTYAKESVNDMKIDIALKMLLHINSELTGDLINLNQHMIHLAYNVALISFVLGKEDQALLFIKDAIHDKETMIKGEEDEKHLQLTHDNELLKFYLLWIEILINQKHYDKAMEQLHNAIEIYQKIYENKPEPDSKFQTITSNKAETITLKMLKRSYSTITYEDLSINEKNDKNSIRLLLNGLLSVIEKETSHESVTKELYSNEYSNDTSNQSRKIDKKPVYLTDQDKKNITKYLLNEVIIPHNKKRNPDLDTIQRFFLFMTTLSLHQLNLLNKKLKPSVSKKNSKQVETFAQKSFNELPIQIPREFKLSLTPKQMYLFDKLNVSSLVREDILKNPSNAVTLENLDYSILYERENMINKIEKYNPRAINEIVKEMTHVKPINNTYFGQLLNMQIRERYLHDHVRRQANAIISRTNAYIKDNGLDNDEKILWIKRYINSKKFPYMIEACSKKESMTFEKDPQILIKCLIDEVDLLKKELK